VRGRGRVLAVGDAALLPGALSLLAAERDWMAVDGDRPAARGLFRRPAVPGPASAANGG
jgi:hypothetical protein